MYWIPIYSYDSKQESELLDPQLSIFFQNYGNNIHFLNILLIFGRCHRDLAVVIFATHESHLIHRGREFHICIGNLGLFGAKPYSEQLIASCYMDQWEHVSVQFEWKIKQISYEILK